MSRWFSVPNDAVRLRNAQVILDHCGIALVGCLVVVAIGLYQGVFSFMHLPICILLGMMMAWCWIRSWPSQTASKWTGWVSGLIASAVIRLGLEANPATAHDVPFWQVTARIWSVGGCYFGCVLASAFLLLWMFRDVFAGRIDAALKP